MKALVTLIFTFLICVNLTGQDLDRSVERFVDYSSGTLVFTNVRLIDGTGVEAIENMTIIVINDLISEIGPSQQISIPDGATIIECDGKTIIPGLVMLHEHLFYSKPFESSFSVGQMTFTFPRMYLAGGVTTIRTAASIQTQSDINIRTWIDEGKMTGPNIDVTGPFIERSAMNIPELTFIQKPEDASATVNYWSEMGATSFKVYMNVTARDLEETVNAAHANGYKVTGHLCALTYREAADIGIDNLEHGFMASSDFVKDKVKDKCNSRAMRNALAALDKDSPEMDKLIDHLISNEVALTSTLTVFEPYTNREVVLGGGIDALAPQIKEKVLMGYARRVNKDSSSLALFKKEMIWEKKFYDKGGLLVAGTDPTGAGRVIPGYSNWRQVELLVEGGFTPLEAIKIATLNGALYLGKEKMIGTIEIGKKADLVLINGKPDQNIRDIRNVELVFKNGIGFNSSRIFESVKGQVGLY